MSFSRLRKKLIVAENSCLPMIDNLPPLIPLTHCMIFLVGARDGFPARTISPSLLCTHVCQMASSHHGMWVICWLLLSISVQLPESSTYISFLEGFLCPPEPALPTHTSRLSAWELTPGNSSKQMIHRMDGYKPVFLWRIGWDDSQSCNLHCFPEHP